MLYYNNFLKKETLSKILKSDDINQEVKKKINDSSSPPLGKVTELEDIDSLQPSEEDITSSQITDISEYSSGNYYYIKELKKHK